MKFTFLRIFFGPLARSLRVAAIQEWGKRNQRKGAKKQRRKGLHLLNPRWVGILTESWNSEMLKWSNLGSRHELVVKNSLTTESCGNSPSLKRLRMWMLTFGMELSNNSARAEGP
jgi:hypothetical protein